MGFPGPEMTVEISFRTGRDITAVMDVAEVSDSGNNKSLIGPLLTLSLSLNISHPK